MLVITFPGSWYWRKYWHVTLYCVDLLSSCGVTMYFNNEYNFGAGHFPFCLNYLTIYLCSYYFISC
jgi:hypothetical protein